MDPFPAADQRGGGRRPICTNQARISKRMHSFAVYCLGWLRCHHGVMCSPTNTTQLDLQGLGCTPMAPGGPSLSAVRQSLKSLLRETSWQLFVTITFSRGHVDFHALAPSTRHRQGNYGGLRVAPERTKKVMHNLMGPVARSSLRLRRRQLKKRIKQLGKQLDRNATAADLVPYFWMPDKHRDGELHIHLLLGAPIGGHRVTPAVVYDYCHGEGGRERPKIGRSLALPFDPSKAEGCFIYLTKTVQSGGDFFMNLPHRQLRETGSGPA